ncbi:MAG TPA: hypothetical protein VMH83_00230 [Candidatus Acidoferrum sp.]|nr:hypothetical protein [Candidatus Acidoferrum sp.]
MSVPTMQLLVLGAMVLFAWLMVKLVRYNKSRRVNTELWCTVFEGLTQGAVRLDDLKAPEEVIEKKARRDGKDKDPFDLDETEQAISREILERERERTTQAKR